MALRPTANDLRIKRLAESGAGILREQGHTLEASAIDVLLSAAGWPMLGRLRAAAGSTGLHPNLPIQMVTTVRDEIKANVEKAAKEAWKAEEARLAALTPTERAKEDAEKALSEDAASDVISIPAEAEKALKAFLAGEFVPEQPERAARGAGPQKSNLNVRVDPQLRKDAEDFGADNAAEFGWAPRASHIIAAWLIARYASPKKQAAAE